jgi:hypothetical protein
LSIAVAAIETVVLTVAPEAGDEIATTGAVVSGAAVVEKLPSVLVARLPAASRDLTR